MEDDNLTMIILDESRERKQIRGGKRICHGRGMSGVGEEIGFLACNGWYHVGDLNQLPQLVTICILVYI